MMESVKDLIRHANNDPKVMKLRIPLFLGQRHFHFAGEGILKVTAKIMKMWKTHF